MHDIDPKPPYFLNSLVVLHENCQSYRKQYAMNNFQLPGGGDIIKSNCKIFVKNKHFQEKHWMKN